MLAGLDAFEPLAGGRDEAALLNIAGRVARGAVTATGRAWTDNRGNTAVIARGMRTKCPLCVILMELTAQLELCELDLELRPARAAPRRAGSAH